MTHTIEYLDRQGNVLHTSTSTLFALSTRAQVGQGITGEVIAQDVRSENPPILDHHTIGLVNPSVFDLIEQKGQVTWKPSRGTVMTFALWNPGDSIRLMLYDAQPSGDQEYRGLRITRNKSASADLPVIPAP